MVNRIVTNPIQFKTIIDLIRLSLRVTLGRMSNDIRPQLCQVYCHFKGGQMFKAILDSPRPLKSGLVTVTMTCKKSDLHSIVDLMGLTVTVYGENEAQITDDRAVSLARIRSLDLRFV